MLHSSICVLGRQPALGLAELESLYGADSVRPISTQVAGLTLDAADVDFARLGGATKLANVLGEIPSTNWKLIEKALTALVRSPSFGLPDSGKFHLGLSAIGFDISPAKLGATGLTLKKVIRSRYQGSVRLAPNTATELSSAQVFHNHLSDANGCELLIIAQGNTTVVARTVAVQDIDSYTVRDRGRPKRDARVGMLPPKLAQIIINLAAGSSKSQDAHTSAATRAHSASVSEKRTGEERAGGEQSDTDTRGRGETPPHSTEETLPPTILDPFCGTGVVLQEALLMGYTAYGTDLEPRMISYTKQNLEWLCEKWKVEGGRWSVEVGDATTHQWRMENGERRMMVACETYLGRPFTERPAPDVLAQTVSDVNLIIKRFLQNIHPQLTPGSRLCLAVPAWFVDNNVKHLPVITSVGELGFERVIFKHADTNELIYHREDQVVGRELLVLQSKP